MSYEQLQVLMSEKARHYAASMLECSRHLAQPELPTWLCWASTGRSQKPRLARPGSQWGPLQTHVLWSVVQCLAHLLRITRDCLAERRLPHLLHIFYEASKPSERPVLSTNSSWIARVSQGGNRAGFIPCELSILPSTDAHDSSARLSSGGCSSPCLWAAHASSSPLEDDSSQRL
jgi:hypothetical protein